MNFFCVHHERRDVRDARPRASHESAREKEGQQIASEGAFFFSIFFLKWNLKRHQNERHQVMGE